MRNQPVRLVIPLLLTLGFLLILSTVLFSPQKAVALNCNVPGDYPLIQSAINDANCDTIQVAAGVFTENITINRTVVIHGAGMGSTTVDGNFSGSVFSIQSGLTVTLTDITLTNGEAAFGGGIYNIGSTLLVNRVNLLGNTADMSGGGIYNFNGETIIFDSEFSMNQALTVNGGGIYQAFTDSSLIIRGSTLTQNSAVMDGGAVYSSGGDLDIQNTKIISNSAERYGGGVANETGILTISSSEILTNTADYQGGGINNTGIVTVTHSTIRGNQAVHPMNITGLGGGIANDGTVNIMNSIIRDNLAHSSGGGTWNAGTINLIRSTVDHNQARNATSSGGGVSNGGQLIISQSTISHNMVIADGGGIANSGTVSITNSTLSDNSANGAGALQNRGTAVLLNATLSDNSSFLANAAGILASDGGLTMTNTIVAANADGNDCQALGGMIVSKGHNLDSDNSCNLTEITDFPNTNPQLGPLQENGGLTETHALLSGSPAINTGDSSSCPTEDQRGTWRLPGACDIGAYERGFMVYLPVVMNSS